jgi:hypothetical protein
MVKNLDRDYAAFQILENPHWSDREVAEELGDRDFEVRDFDTDLALVAAVRLELKNQKETTA